MIIVVKTRDSIPFIADAATVGLPAITVSTVQDTTTEWSPTSLVSKTTLTAVVSAWLPAFQANAPVQVVLATEANVLASDEKTINLEVNDDGVHGIPSEYSDRYTGIPIKDTKTTLTVSGVLGWITRAKRSIATATAELERSREDLQRQEAQAGLLSGVMDDTFEPEQDQRLRQLRSDVSTLSNNIKSLGDTIAARLLVLGQVCSSSEEFYGELTPDQGTKVKEMVDKVFNEFVEPIISKLNDARSQGFIDAGSDATLAAFRHAMLFGEPEDQVVEDVADLDLSADLEDLQPDPDVQEPARKTPSVRRRR